MGRQERPRDSIWRREPGTDGVFRACGPRSRRPYHRCGAYQGRRNGTHEIFTVAASATIGYHQKPVILYNLKGFWNPLIQLLDDLQERGMVRGQWRDYINVISKLEDLDLQ